MSWAHHAAEGQSGFIFRCRCILQSHSWAASHQRRNTDIARKAAVIGLANVPFSTRIKFFIRSESAGDQAISMPLTILLPQKETRLLSNGLGEIPTGYNCTPSPADLRHWPVFHKFKYPASGSQLASSSALASTDRQLLYRGVLLPIYLTLILYLFADVGM